MKYSLTLAGLAAVASAQQFTSIFNITATPDQVVNAQSQPAPGQPGARGQFNYAINSKTETICYDITLFGVSGTPQSPARTATHIHEGAVGRNGPPRIAFPNPVGDDAVRRSVGCLTGPFTTGLKAADNVTDTGAGFKLAQIEANPSGFFTDFHSNLFVPGVVRGQLGQSFQIIDDGAKLTTATLTRTQVSTISSCAPTVTNCPYKTAPVVTQTAIVYTTVCPVSELPYYTKPATSAGPIVPTKPANGTAPVTVPVTKPATTIPAITYPATTISSGGSFITKPATTVPAVVIPATTIPAVVGTGSPVAPTSPPPYVTANAGSVQKAGGFVAVAAVVAAALI